MDISQIDNIQELKSMAYDQIITIETAQANLKTIQTRIQQIYIETKEDK
jgi:hypothetical protein